MKRLTSVSIVFTICVVFANFLSAADPVNKAPLADKANSLAKQSQAPKEVIGTVLGVNLVSNGDSNVLSFIVDKPFVANVRLLNLPYRLFVDIPAPYQWRVPPEQLSKVPVSFVQGFRYGNPTEEIFRIVVDMSRNAYLGKVYVKDVVGTVGVGSSNDKQYEFGVELVLNSSGANSRMISSNTMVFSSSDKATLQRINKVYDGYYEEKRKANKNKSLEAKIKRHLANVSYPAPILSKTRPLVVFIDAGHGGKDPGASGNGGMIEKDLVLNISMAIKTELEKNTDISVVLTRDADHYLPLNDRILWAQHMGADLFVSIHADKNPSNTDSSGLSIYTLSDVASDAQTQLIANTENRSDIVAGVNLNNDDGEVNQILFSLSQRIKANESITLAKNIIEQASKTLKIMPNPLRSAGFAVLKLPSTPSVLVELGFLSNQDDVNEFRQADYVARSSITLAAGIEYYLWQKGDLKNFPVGVTSLLNNYVDKDILGLAQKEAEEEKALAEAEKNKANATAPAKVEATSAEKK